MRGKAKPTLAGCADHDCARFLKQQNGAVKQTLMPWQRDREILSPLRGRQEPAPVELGTGQPQFVEAVAMLQMMDPLGE